MKRRMSASLFLAVFFIPAFFVFSQAKEQAFSKRIIGYYINWGMYPAHNSFGPQNIPWTKITHINYAFATIIAGSWTIKGTDDWADVQCGPQQNGQIGQINTMKTQYGVKTLISVGGWTCSGNFSAMAATDAGRTAFANDCVRYIRQYKFDGVDIDWEYPGFVRAPDVNLAGDQGCNGQPADKGNFTLLLQTLRQKLDAAAQADGTAYYLSIAAPGGYDKIEGPITFQEPDKYNQYVDWLNVMTYDFHGAWDTLTGHLAGLYANPNDRAAVSPIDIKDKYNGDAIIKYYASKGVPAAKMNIGAAYYGRSWKNVADGGTSGLFQHATARDFYETPWNYGVEPFYTLKPWETNTAYVSRYDSVAKAPSIYDPSGKFFYTYDNEKSIGDKCDYVVSNQLGGLFFWEFTGDYPILGSTLTSVIFKKISNVSVKIPEVGGAKNPASPSVFCSAIGNHCVFTTNSVVPMNVTVVGVSGRVADAFVLKKGDSLVRPLLPLGIYFLKAEGGAEQMVRIVATGGAHL